MRKVSVVRIFISLLCLGVIDGCASALAPSVNKEPTALRPGAYQLDPDHSTLLFKISHFGISTYVGRFNSFDASLDFDPENPGNSYLEAVIDVSSLDVNNAPFAKTLKGPNWFDTDNYPEATFISSVIEITGDNVGTATGDLTIKGITQPATIKITFNGGTRNTLTTRYTIGFDGVTSFNRSSFGIDRFAAFVGDEINLEFYGEFQRR